MPHARGDRWWGQQAEALRERGLRASVQSRDRIFIDGLLPNGGVWLKRAERCFELQLSVPASTHLGRDVYVVARNHRVGALIAGLEERIRAFEAVLRLGGAPKREGYTPSG